MKKLTSRTNHIIVTSIVCSLALMAGTGLGIFFGMKYLKAVPNYNYSAEALEDDYQSLMNRYSKANGDYTNFKGYELANIGIYKFDETTNHYSVTDGWVKATGITQTIKGTSIRQENDYFNESISASSIVKVAKRFYQDEPNQVNLFNGSSIKNGSSATWNVTPSDVLNCEEYEDLWGKQLSRSSIYVISSKTVLDSSFSLNDEQNYVIDVELDPVLSVVRYVKQMKEMSNLERYPTFSKVHIQFILDNQLNLISRCVSEQYEVYKLGFHQSDSVINEYYYQDVEIDIPDLSTNCIYE